VKTRSVKGGRDTSIGVRGGQGWGGLEFALGAPELQRRDDFVSAAECENLQVPKREDTRAEHICH